MAETLEKIGLKNKNSKRFGYLFWSVSMGTLLFLIVAFLLVSRQPSPKVTFDDQNSVSVESELSIDFEWPIARQIEIDIQPSVHGEIEYGDMIMNDQLAQAITFQPELTWLPGTTYEITLSNVKSAIPSYHGAKEYKLYFTTEEIPNISNVKPIEYKNTWPDISWEVFLNKANDNLAIFDFIIDPLIDTEVTLSEDKKTYTIEPAELLSQGQEYTLDIQRKLIRYKFDQSEIAFQGEAESIWSATWTTREAPGIESFSPQGDNISLNEDITVVFDENVDFDSFKDNVSISPELVGTWQTDDYKTLTYITSAMQKETKYEVTISKGLSTFEGGYLEEESVHSFTTLGAMKISSSNPSSGNTGINIQSNIEMIFDQHVDRPSAESKFSIAPNIEGTFLWDENKMIFNPTSTFDFNTTYTASLATGIKSNSGFDMVQDFSTSFSTELSVTKLPIAFNRQDHNLSCEVATLVMALSYHGVIVPEQPLIDAIGFDPTAKANGVWGNPNIAFVGDIDGRQPSTGYGVYWDPIAKVGNTYRTSTAFSGWTVSQVTEEIKKGHPVIIWGTAGSGTRIDWKTSDGGNVVAINGEHTFLVIGFVGSANDPSKIIVLDPLYGERYKTRSSFEWMWGLLGNSGVVVE
ncbi:MAG: Ig-like domain-containing protein [bacterium]|nr:Ig-like domain-containing protein [bacterium]